MGMVTAMTGEITDMITFIRSAIYGGYNQLAILAARNRMIPQIYIRDHKVMYSTKSYERAPDACAVDATRYENESYVCENRRPSGDGAGCGNRGNLFDFEFFNGAGEIGPVDGDDHGCGDGSTNGDGFGYGYNRDKIYRDGHCDSKTFAKRLEYRKCDGGGYGNKCIPAI